MDYQEVIIGLCVSAVLSWACLIGLFLWVRMGKRIKRQSDINKLVHLGKDMRPLTEVSLYGRTGIIIGRNTTGQLVELDLSNGDGAGEVAQEHAVLNYAGGAWYLEAVNENHRVGIRKGGDSLVYRVKAMTPYKVGKGDLIFIAHEKIAVL